jgi:hypothetical protein
MIFGFKISDTGSNCSIHVCERGISPRGPTIKLPPDFVHPVNQTLVDASKENSELNCISSSWRQLTGIGSFESKSAETLKKWKRR